MAVMRHFLGWDEPVTTKVRNFLLPAKVVGAADLAADLIVVPTRQAGRRLCQALALRCAESGAALLSAHAVQPAFFLSSDADLIDRANQAVVKTIWADALSNIAPDEYPGFFPAGAPEQDFTWALNTGELIQSLRENLSDGGYGIGDISEKFGAVLQEPERWRDLARLERLYLDKIKRLGLQDQCAQKIARANEPRLPDGVKRIVVAAVPDPSLLMIRAIEAAADRLRVDILIHAPESHSGRFDDWGRPLPDKWRDVRIDIPDPDRNIILAASPRDQARKAIETIACETGNFGPCDIAIAVPDKAVIPFLETELGENGLPAFDPSDKPLMSHPICRLLQSFCGVAGDGRYSSVGSFLRHPDILAYFQEREGISPHELLDELDRFQNRYLPAGLSEITDRLAARLSVSSARNADFSSLVKAITFINERIARFSADGCSAALRSFLQTIYDARKIDGATVEGREFMAAAEEVDESLRELADGPAGVAEAGMAETLALCHSLLGGKKYHRDREDSLVDLEGWLDISWNDAPMLIVTGMNEGFVPDSRLGDVFLPDSLRTALKLRDNSWRLARDAYLMTGMIESRGTSGRACFIAGKYSGSGDPLRPSRLLFRCPDSELPGRAEKLFGPVSENNPEPPPSISFKLDPGAPRDVATARLPLRKLSVTAFKDYLACPFRFYLKHVLQMEALSDEKATMDAMDFGSMIHELLKLMARNPDVNSSGDESAIRAFLLDEAGRWVAARFGARPPLTVAILLETARQRLARLAGVQAELTRAGWIVAQAEQEHEIDIDGMRVSGKIDRIDRNDAMRRVRIMDYKSSDTAETPEEAHIGPLMEHTPEFARVTVGDKIKAWLDLQLPLYETMAGVDSDPAWTTELCYFNLPKAVVDTGIYSWASFDGKMLDSARKCAQGVVQAIAAGRFWPPTTEKLKHDEFADLFPGAPDQCFEGILSNTQKNIETHGCARYY